MLERTVIRGMLLQVFLEPCWGAQMSSRKSPFSTPLLYLSFRTGISLIKRRHDFSLRGGFWVGFKPGFEPVQTRVQSDSNLGSNSGFDREAELQISLHWTTLQGLVSGNEMLERQAAA